MSWRSAGRIRGMLVNRGWRAFRPRRWSFVGVCQRSETRVCASAVRTHGWRTQARRKARLSGTFPTFRLVRRWIWREAPLGERTYAVTRNGLHGLAMLREQPLAAGYVSVRWLPQWNSLLGS